MQSELVVVHRLDGTLNRGLLEWDTTTSHVVPPAPLPEILQIRCDNQGAASLVQVSELKAIFFVKRHEGALDHDEVKFFSDVAATDLWIRVRFADGEVLEGRTHNNSRLLFDAGIWLRPFDSTGNNVLVYVPKSSVVEFHVMGVAVHRPARVATVNALPSTSVL
jgi:hypothetical protein